MAEDAALKFGRKIFFICPDYFTNKDLLPKLREREYELYSIPEVKNAKYILKNEPTAIVYITIGQPFSTIEWFNYIKYLSEQIPTLKFGLLAKELSYQEKIDFEANINFEAGVFSTDSIDEALATGISKKLEELSAKGQRKYVRTTCDDDQRAVGVIIEHGNALTLKIKDISVMGAACSCPAKAGIKLEERMLLRHIAITLAGKRIIVDAVILRKKVEIDTSTIVLLFTKTDPESSQIIHAYIATKAERFIKDYAPPKEEIDTGDYKGMSYYDNLVLQK